MSGVITLVVALVALVVLMWLNVPRGWRLALVIPFAISANGFLQARERTCVVLAAMGTRETDDGGYARVSDAERAAAMRQMRWIVVRAALIAVVATAISWVA